MFESLFVAWLYPLEYFNMHYLRAFYAIRTYNYNM